jgi:hypothetical protein
MSNSVKKRADTEGNINIRPQPGFNRLGIDGATSVFAMFFPFGKAGALQNLCCQGFAVEYYGFTLSAAAVKRSGFGNIVV